MNQQINTASATTIVVFVLEAYMFASSFHQNSAALIPPYATHLLISLCANSSR